MPDKKQNESESKQKSIWPEKHDPERIKFIFRPRRKGLTKLYKEALKKFKNKKSD